MVESYGVAAFRSRQQVLRFEQQLRQEGIGNIRVVSTPREVAVGCGLSIQFSLADAPAVVGAIRRRRQTAPKRPIALEHGAPSRIWTYAPNRHASAQMVCWKITQKTFSARRQFGIIVS